MNRKRKQSVNPYLLYYLSFAVICCMCLGFCFLFIYYENAQKLKDSSNMEKLELVTDTLNEQFDMQEQVKNRIRIGTVYQPFYFQANKYFEVELLKDFTRFDAYPPLKSECFLYYGDDVDLQNILFFSKGKTIRIQEYFAALTPEERDELLQTFFGEEEEMQIFSGSENLYFLYHLQLTGVSHNEKAVLGFAISFQELEERFRIISGGMQGAFALYELPAQAGEAVYANRETACLAGDKGALTMQTRNEKLQIVWTPEKEGTVFGILPTQLLAALIILFLLFALASFFAWRSYLPLGKITDKYRESIPVENGVFYKDKIEELNDMMGTVLEHNLKVNAQLEQKKEQLRSQMLAALLNGNVAADMQSYFAQMQILLPGPYYFVFSILFYRQEIKDHGFYDTLKEQISLLKEPRENKYVEPVFDREHASLSVICSIPEPECREELKEEISSVAESFGLHLLTGCGNVYGEISRISASYLESMDTAHERGRSENETYDKAPVYRLCAALSKGEKEQAEELLEAYAGQLKRGKMSFLMQQYIFSDFLCEVMKTAKDSRIELPHQMMSLILSARNVDAFQKAAHDLIEEFGKRIREKKQKEESEESIRVCAYIKEHFTEYDLSIDKAAEQLHTNVAYVRRAIKEQTGKNYKEYLIFLRIGLAKELLVKEDLTVAQICEKVGYGNISYFIKIFKEVTGTTPAAYRDHVEKLG